MVEQFVQMIGETGIMFNFNTANKDYSDELYLPVSSIDQKQAWESAQNQSNAIARYNAYLNLLCLKTFLSWFKDWIEATNLPEPKVWQNEESLANIWEFVNGTVIQMGETRLVLIPSDEADAETFCVPQEWIDIPSWVGDYYLAIQVNLDDDEGECAIEVRGFITHRQLKNNGRYNESDRTYSVPLESLVPNLTTLELTIGLGLRQEIPSLTEISAAETAKVLSILGNASVYFPRLRVDIPFAHWAALLDNQKTRQQFYHQRSGKTLINLRQWLQTNIEAAKKAVEEIWQSSDILFAEAELVRGSGRTENTSTADIASVIALLNPNKPDITHYQAAGVLGEIAPGNPDAIKALTKLLQTTKNEQTRWQASLSLGKIDPGNPLAGVNNARLIDFGIQLNHQKLGLIVAIMPTVQGRLSIRVQLKPVDSASKLPPHLKLSVLSETGEVIPGLEEESGIDADGKGKTNLLTLNLNPKPGKCFQVRVTLGELSVTEYFIA